MQKYFDEEQMARRIRRKVERGQRQSKVMSCILFVVVLILGLAALYAIVSHWFTLL